jgi:DNA-binding CsgD family transcriptional regulator
MATLDEFSDLVSLIYDAALDFERWPIVLERLADALGGSATGLAKHNFVNNGGAVVTARADPVFGQLYAQHYANLNVLFQRAGMVPVETCLTDRDVMPKAEFFRTEFYNDFVRPQDTHSVLTAYVLAEGDWRATISIGRSPRRGEWEREHLDLMRRLAPHLHRAAQFNLRLGEARLAEASTAEALDGLTPAVIIVGGDSQVQFVNSAASAIVAEADGLSIDRTGLRAAVAAESAVLRKLIARAAAGTPAAGGMLTLSRPSQRRPLAVLVAPLQRRPAWFVDHGPRAIVSVVDPEQAPVVPEKYLQRLYGLTRAEAAITVQILRGQGLQAAADSLGISLATVRTHLQNVFAKTGTRRQSQLVRLIAQSQAGVQFDRFAL